MFSLYCLSSLPPLLFLSPLPCFFFLYFSANLALLISPPTPSFFSILGIFPFPPSLPICPPSHSLFFSSSSSAAECCPSYLCSRLGMFFLLMTSFLSLPLHHFLFSVWAAHLPRVSYLSLPNHLDYCRRFIGCGGSEAGPCHD